MKGKAVSGLMLALLLIGILPASFYVQPVEAVTTSTITYDYYVVAGHNITPTPPSPVPSPTGFNFTVDPPVFNFGNVTYWGGRTYLYDGFWGSPKGGSGARVNITNLLGYDITILDLTAEVTDGTPTKDFFFAPGNVTFGNWTMVIVDTLDPGEYDECNYTTGMVEVNRLVDGDTYNKITGDPHSGERNQGPGSLLEPDADGDAAATGHVAPIALANGATFTEYFGVIIFGDADVGTQINGTITLSLTYEYTIPGSPVASFTYSPTHPTIGETVTFNASTSTPDGGNLTDPDSYVWDFGDETNGTGMIINHTYTTPGIYTVALNVTDSDGKWSSTSKSVSVGTSETTIFEDDFESYSVGTFPSAGGWELWTSGAGSEHQVIVDSFSNSPTKSLQLLGQSGWSAFAAHPYSTTQRFLSYEVHVRINELATQYSIARVGFVDWYSYPTTPRFFSAVAFMFDGTIRLAGYGELQTFVPGEWYKVKQVTDRVNDVSSVWINDVLKASNVPVTDSGPPRPDVHFNDTIAFAVASLWPGVEAYFDDAKLVEGTTVITILSPQNRSYASTSVPLTFTVNEATSWMGYSLDGQANVTVAGNTTLTGLLEGSHYVVVYTNNTSGEMWASSQVYFTVDLTPPTVSVLSPENTTYVAFSVPLTFTVSESTSWMGYSLDDQANVTISGNTTLVGLTEGPHSVVVYVNDTAENMGASSEVSFTLSIPPVISILSPENTSYAVNDLPLTFTVDVPADWIGYSLDDQANVTITGNTTLTSLAEGPHDVVVYANDTVGDMGSSQVYFTVDLTPPTVSVLSPENTTYVAFSVPLTFTVSEPTSWKAYSLDDQANVTISGNTTLSGLTEGTHSVVVYVKDVAGNTGVSNKVFFTLELPVGISYAISLEPSKTILALGYTVTVTVTITNITDCAGYQLWIDYDPALLEMVSWTFDTDPAHPLSPTQMAPAPADRIDTNASVNGSVKIATIWKAGVPAYSHTGASVAAEITFKGKTKGNSTLVFDQYWTKAVDPNADELIFVIFNDAWVFVTLPGDVDGDRDVDVGDQRKVALCMFTTPASPHWDPNMDIDRDLDVDVGDQRKQQLNMFDCW